MKHPDPTQLIHVLCGKEVFGRDVDSKILQGANEVSGRAMFELFRTCNTNSTAWASEFADDLMELSTGDPSALISLDDGRWQGLEEDWELPLAEDSPSATDYYLKLEFSDSDACYYQFPLFPSLDETFIAGGARKREDQFQHLMVTLAHPADLQVFIQNLRSNPHLKHVHDSSEEEFNQSPSHAV